MKPDWQPHFKSFSPFKVWQQETLNDWILFVRAAHYVGSNPPPFFLLRLNDTLQKKNLLISIFSSLKQQIFQMYSVIWDKCDFLRTSTVYKGHWTYCEINQPSVWHRQFGLQVVIQKQMQNVKNNTGTVLINRIHLSSQDMA